MSGKIFLFWVLPGCIWDIRSHRVPVAWIWAGMICAFLFWGVRELPLMASGRETGWSLMGSCGISLLPGAVFLALSGMKQHGLGKADGWFMVVLGLWKGGKTAYGGMLYGIFLAAVFALLGLCFGLLHRHSRLPMIPFLTAGWLIFELCSVV